MKEIQLQRYPGRIIEVGNKNYLYFGGTSYLGINSDGQFKQLFLEGISQFGINCGTSRNNNVSLTVFDEAEHEASSRFGAEDSIIVSSGYLAAQLVTQFYQPTHKMFYLEDSHPALKIGENKSATTSEIVGHINNSYTPTVIFSNSVNNLHPQKHAFEWVKEIDPDKNIVLVIDDSHGIGITNPVYTKLSKQDNLDILVVASMAKGLGIDAGLILGNKKILNKLRTTPIYAGASPPSPALLHAFIQGGKIYMEELKKLQGNTIFFNQLISGKTGISYIKGFPVYLLHDKHAYEKFFERGIVISSFPYPDPQGKRLNRIVLNSLHEGEDLTKVAELL